MSESMYVREGGEGGGEGWDGGVKTPFFFTLEQQARSRSWRVFEAMRRLVRPWHAWAVRRRSAVLRVQSASRCWSATMRQKERSTVWRLGRRSTLEKEEGGRKEEEGGRRRRKDEGWRRKKEGERKGERRVS